MALSLVTAPDGEPITPEDAQAHLRVDADDDLALIQTLIVTAREYVETYTRRALLTQTWDLALDSFCDPLYRCEDGSLRLPKAPVASITSITYIDGAGVSQTWSTDDWDADLPSGPKAMRARIYPAYEESYPSTRSQPNAVTIRFVAGYGATGEFVPASLRSAMLLLIGHWYAIREGVNVGNITSELPMGVEALLAGYVAY